MLKRAALVAVVLAVVGCGSMEKTGGPEPEPTERHLVYEKIIGERGIWIADVDGGQPRLLFAGGRAPQISTDGKWVAYLDECDPSTALCSIFLVPVSGGKSRLLARGSYGEFSWSPDSNRIAPVRLLDEEDLDETLRTIDVASGDSVTLAEGHLYGWSFSPDGKQIVYAVAHEPSPEGFNAEKIDLFVATSDGGDGERITDTGDAGYPVWGPKSIAFAKLIPCGPRRDPRALPGGCKNGAWARHEIWRIQPDGKGREPIISPTPERFLGQGMLA